MHLVIILVLLLAVVFAPSWWVKRVMQRYSEPEDRYPGSGGELARHLLDGLKMNDVAVEVTDQGDHYDPRDKTVRLTPGNYSGHSLTAITVAAHEVGHALQDRDSYPPLRWRSRLVALAGPLQKAGAVILMASPLIGIVTRVPQVGLLMLAGGLLTMGTATLIHLVTLPTELDASFRRALPMLTHGEILKAVDRPHARKILAAAALTYVASSLVSLLNIGRWWAILRR